MNFDQCNERLHQSSKINYYYADRESKDWYNN